MAIVRATYSREDMKSFADWCRNGLLNTEYSVDKLEEHLSYWEKWKSLENSGLDEKLKTWD